MSPDDVLELLGIDIRPARMKCAMLSLETLHGALEPDASKSVDPAPASAGQA